MGLPTKGELLGECNRTACTCKRACWYNHSTKKYYCTKCAMMINDMNPESLEIHGHDLCTLGDDDSIDDDRIDSFKPID